jgi:uncharacterized membrane protein
VQTSRYASLLGVPVALLGLIIHAICSSCASSAIVFTLLAILGTARVLRMDGAQVGAAAASA